jgi:predicted MPP superfamily phosphohydrolase
MRKMAFLIFFSIVLLIYGSINYYIYIRGMQSLPSTSIIRDIFPYVFWLLASTFVAGRIMEKVYLSELSDVLVWTGSFWLAGMLYFFLAVLFLDLLRLINYFVPFFPALVTRDYTQFKFWLSAGVTISVMLLITAGHINTLFPVVRKLDIHIAKDANNMKELNAVVLSDIHLGTIINNGHFAKIVEKVRALNPDIILLAGDVLDEDLEPVLRQNIGETLRSLKAPLGVYAVMGNHEYIGGADPAYKYLTEHGLQVIRDSVVKINDSFYLVGREDRDKPRFSGKERLPLNQLIGMADNKYPVILMDHQPYYPELASELGVDLQLSGHTHHGQLWPLNFATNAIFTVSRGYKKIGNMHTYVSNGVGTWGPPVRIGNRPEIVQLNIRFD